MGKCSVMRDTWCECKIPRMVRNCGSNKVACTTAAQSGRMKTYYLLKRAGGHDGTTRNRRPKKS